MLSLWDSSVCLCNLKGQPGQHLLKKKKKKRSMYKLPQKTWVSTFGFQPVATAVRGWVLTPSSGLQASHPSAITRKCSQNPRSSRLRSPIGARWELVLKTNREKRMQRKRGTRERQMKAGTSLTVHLRLGLLIGMCETLIPARYSPGGHPISISLT